MSPCFEWARVGCAGEFVLKGTGFSPYIKPVK
jgi:hypothetical protein